MVKKILCKPANGSLLACRLAWQGGVRAGVYTKFYNVLLPLLLPFTVLLLLVGKSHAQPGFNKWFDFDIAASFHNVTLKEDTLIIVGTTKYPVTNKWGLLFVKMDTLGNILDSRLHTDSSGYQYAFEAGYSIVKTSDGGYATTGINFDLGHTFLAKLNVDGDIQFLREYTDSTAVVTFPRKLITLSDGYFIAGLKQRLNLHLDWYLTKTDPQGNALWHKYYGETDLNEGFGNIIQLEENRFVLCGSKGLFTEPYDYQQDIGMSWIIEIDSLGEIQSEWQSENHVDGFVSDIVLMPDNNWIYATMPIEILSSNLLGVVNKIVKRNADFDLVWEKTLSPTSWGGGTNWTRAIAQTPDGNYVVVASWILPVAPNPPFPTPPLYIPGCLTKLSPDGDSLWQRCDTVDMAVPTHDHRYGGMVVLPSGSIVAVGNFDEQTTSKVWAWVVKVDKDGCLEELCVKTGIDDLQSNQGVHVFPNPSNRFVTFRLPAWTTDTTIEVMDAGGRVVWQQQMTANTVVWEHGHLPQGVYFYRIFQQGESIQEGKVVVQR